MSNEKWCDAPHLIILGGTMLKEALYFRLFFNSAKENRKKGELNVQIKTK